MSLCNLERKSCILVCMYVCIWGLYFCILSFFLWTKSIWMCTKNSNKIKERKKNTIISRASEKIIWGITKSNILLQLHYIPIVYLCICAFKWFFSSCSHAYIYTYFYDFRIYILSCVWICSRILKLPYRLKYKIKIFL